MARPLVPKSGIGVGVGRKTHSHVTLSVAEGSKVVVSM